MGLLIAKFLSECFTPVCLDDCEIEDAGPTIIVPIQSAHSMELYIPPPPELEIDLEAGKINSMYGNLTTSCALGQATQQLSEIELEKLEPPINFDIASSDDDVNSMVSNPSDKTFDYGVIALEQPAEPSHKKNEMPVIDCDSVDGSISEDSIFDDIVIV